jgi:hypothetical protein
VTFKDLAGKMKEISAPFPEDFEKAIKEIEGK